MKPPPTNPNNVQPTRYPMGHSGRQEGSRPIEFDRFALMGKRGGNTRKAKAAQRRLEAGNGRPGDEDIVREYEKLMTK